MIFTGILIISAFIVGTCIVLTLHERREQAACARALRREVAELDLRWPVSEDDEIPVSEHGCEPTPRPGELPHGNAFPVEPDTDLSTHAQIGIEDGRSNQVDHAQQSPRGRNPYRHGARQHHWETAGRAPWLVRNTSISNLDRHEPGI